jgi:hypothetical protein
MATSHGKSRLVEAAEGFWRDITDLGRNALLRFEDQHGRFPEVTSLFHVSMIKAEIPVII